MKGQYSFWDHVHPLFLERDITRHDIRELVKRGLQETKGNYRAVLRLFGIPETDYHRFHNFLTAHACKVDFRNFRTGVDRSWRAPTGPLQGLLITASARECDCGLRPQPGEVCTRDRQ